MKLLDYVHNPTIVGFSFSSLTSLSSLFCMCSCIYEDKYPTSGRVSFGGIVGCPVGQICPKISHFCLQEPIEYRKSHICTQHTTTRRHNVGRCPPLASAAAHGPPLSIPKVCAGLPHNRQHWVCSVCYILHWGVSCVTFYQCILKQNFASQGGRPPRPLPLPVAVCCPTWRNEPAHHIMGNAGYAWLVLLCAGDCPGHQKGDPSRNTYRGRAQASRGRQSMKKRNNQWKDSVGGGGGGYFRQDTTTTRPMGGMYSHHMGLQIR